jgi:hypothetical protein
VNLKCNLLSVLRIHRSDCELCNAQETSGAEMSNRLEELNWETQQHFPNRGDQAEARESLDSKPPAAVNSRVSLKGQKKNAS